MNANNFFNCSLLDDTNNRFAVLQKERVRGRTETQLPLFHGLK